MYKSFKQCVMEQVKSWVDIQDEILLKLKSYRGFKVTKVLANGVSFTYKDFQCKCIYWAGFGDQFEIRGESPTNPGENFGVQGKTFEEAIENTKLRVKHYLHSRVWLTTNPKALKFINSVKSHLPNWNIEYVTVDPVMGIYVYMSKKAYGDGYNAYCQIKNGQIFESDSNGTLEDIAKKIMKETKIKNFVLSGEAD